MTCSLSVQIYGRKCSCLMKCYTIRFASDLFIDLCVVDIGLAVQLRQHGAVLSCLTDFDLLTYYFKL